PTLPNSDTGFGRRQFTAGLGDHLALDTVHDLFGLFLTPVDEHPPRTLGYVPTYQHDREAEYRADRERDAPPPEHREYRGVEEEHRRRGTCRGTEPVRTVDREVRPAPHPAGNQPVERRVERSIPATDTRTGQESDEVEKPRSERERGGHRRNNINGECRDEQFLPPEPVGQLPEEQRTETRTDHIDRPGQ